MNMTRMRPWLKLARALLLSGAGLFMGFLLLDRSLPLPMPEIEYAGVVTAKDGYPLRAFADSSGVWRYPVTIKDVSPLYLQALLGYEDRWFYQHPGVNPLALARAGWQALRNGRIVSGGSTLSMQVARILDPHTRSLAGKCKQIFRALQLEWHFSKDEILTLYLNRAPFGGPVEGLQAASFAWLDKPASELSHAEAALLAVLPQSPSRLRPDRYPKRARAARDKVIARMQKQALWSAREATDARQEQVLPQFLAQPMLAPLLARRLRSESDAQGVITTTIDFGLQASLEQRLSAYLSRLPKQSSAAILIVDNRDLSVPVYIGSGDFMDASRFGHVDMIVARRSPGSTLKPFLYGLAMEDGMIHSESLLVDAPQSFNGYRPGNFLGDFNGPVSAREALQRSLNVPAVDLLDRYGTEKFSARLRNGGLRLFLPRSGEPNLSMILGGAATSLESLVSAYTALARKGMAGKPRYRPEHPLIEKRLLDAGAAWIVRDILESHPRPGMHHASLRMDASRRIAWKTGTSYGYRDAWAIGVSERYTVGVWVGRPDGTPLPGHYGAITAAPLLFDIVDGLPGRGPWAARAPKPDSVTQATICWPLGGLAKSGITSGEEDLCHVKQQAWILDGTAPATLPDRTQSHWSAARVSYWVNADNGLRVDAACKVARRERRELARWPLALEPWLRGAQRERAQLPAADPACPSQPVTPPRDLRIVGLGKQTVLRRGGPKAAPPAVTLKALGARGDLYWLIDGRVIANTGAREAFSYSFSQPGHYEITVSDESGYYDRVSVKVIL